MTAQHIQFLLAAIFLGLGGWCLLFPQTVEALGFLPEFQHMSKTSAVLIGCFGAQAVLAGLIIASADFTPRTFLIFGLFGSIPFFGFNVYFTFVDPMFSNWMLLDFAGNLGILTCGLLGYRLKSQELANLNPQS